MKEVFSFRDNKPDAPAAPSAPAPAPAADGDVPQTGRTTSSEATSTDTSDTERSHSDDEDKPPRGSVASCFTVTAEGQLVMAPELTPRGTHLLADLD